jgi:uncharacterized protein YkwD
LLLLVILLIFGTSEFAIAEESGGYRAYAEKTVSAPPDGVVFREDLETYLSGLASSYRRQKKRPALIVDDLLRNAARAQAVDMMMMGKSSHRSRTGADFKTRFKAYLHAENTTWRGGENAASDRRRGPADEEKARRLFDLWIDSTGHRRNLLNDQFTYVSTGVVQRGDELWSVQIFWSEPVTTNFTIQ